MAISSRLHQKLSWLVQRVMLGGVPLGDVVAVVMMGLYWKRNEC